ncbi:MAG: SDR family NAD(P)-dependent oxidoreductase [Anaerolineae bacterium]
MKVLLTGAFGNVGISTLDELLRQGHTVRCFDLETTTNRRTVRRYRHHIAAGRVEVLWGDLRHRQNVAAAATGVDAVLHVAFIIPKMSHTGIESELRPDWAEAVNVGGTRNLIEALQAQPHPPKLVFTSSLHVYGRTQHLPPPRTVTDPVQPFEHYACHKVACEEMIRASGLSWAILRLAATLPLALKLDPGMFDVPLNNRIEYIHTRDVGLALANAVSSDDIWGKTLLIGGGPRCQFTYQGMIQPILDAMGAGQLPPEAFATAPFGTDWLDTAESQRLLRFQTRDLDDYVRDLSHLLGVRRHFVRLFRPLVRRALLKRSPHWQRQTTVRLACHGQVALVTGASSGIGAASARQLARAGLKVVLVARRGDRLERLVDEIRRDGGEAWMIAADLTDELERLRVLHEATAVAGPVDVLVNSAGFGWYGYGADMPWPVARAMIQTNMTALTHLTLLVLHDMQTRGAGHIINIGSIAGNLPEQGAALYSATKSFVDSFSTALHRELRGTAVHVSLMRLGRVQTEFYDRAAHQPAGRRIPGERLAAVTPEKVAQRVIATLRHPRRVVYIPAWWGMVQWVEPLFGWLLDRLGPVLLRRQPAA